MHRGVTNLCTSGGGGVINSCIVTFLNPLPHTYIWSAKMFFTIPPMKSSSPNM